MIDELWVVPLEREIALYYDAEEGREGRSLDPRRVAARERFVELVRSNDRGGPTLEIGTGPGRDALALIEAGLSVVGLDLSFGHATRAASGGVTMTLASARALPIASGSIGALWSMSTLMHVPSVAIEDGMREVGRVLAPGATVAIGVWGGPDVEHFSGGNVDARLAPRRLFSRRSDRRWRSLLEILWRVDEFEVWEQEGADEDAFRYDLAFATAQARRRSPTPRTRPANPSPPGTTLPPARITPIAAM